MHCDAAGAVMLLIDDIRDRLLDQGYALVPDILDALVLDRVRAACDRRLAASSADHLVKNRTTGSMLGVEHDPAFAELIAWQPTVALLRALGFGQVAWSAGYVISKPPGGPRLFWHQDWLWWTHPISAAATPHQLFAMYYAVDTDVENGCLRVVPGSHRKRLPAHDQLLTAHSEAALSGDDLSHPMFGDIEGEVDVPVRAGDLLIGDARLLHAAHANRSAAPRALITLWYHPAYDAMPSEIQTHLARDYGQSLDHWSSDDRNRVDCALPYRTQDAEAWPICREPHVRF